LSEYINLEDFEINKFALKKVVEDNTISLCLISIERRREMLSSIKADNKNPLFLFSATEKNTAERMSSEEELKTNKKRKKVQKNQTNKQMKMMKLAEKKEVGQKKKKTKNRSQNIIIIYRK
jgi:hypothetical protein